MNLEESKREAPKQAFNTEAFEAEVTILKKEIAERYAAMGTLDQIGTDFEDGFATLKEVETLVEKLGKFIGDKAAEEYFNQEVVGSPLKNGQEIIETKEKGLQ